MKRNFFKGAALAAIALVGFTATAQEEESKGIELTGSVDAYFRTNINGRNSADNNAVPGTSFYNEDGFSVGMINLIASKQIGKVGFVADFAFGPTADEAILGNGTAALVNQAYVTYAASDALTLTFGRFNTFLGYEVISPTGNFNYSTSYLFSYGPFSHTGLKADYSIDDNWSLGVAVMNSTDSPVDENVNGKYTGGLQLGYSEEAGSAYLNFLYGRNGFSSEETFQVDLTTGWDLAEDFYLGFNASFNTTKDAGLDADGVADDQGFYGVALYPQYAFSEAFTLGLRAEYFEAFGGLDAGIGTEALFVDPLTLEEFNGGDVNVFATTLTGSYTVGALTIKPELRIDISSEDAFADGPALGDVNDSLSSFVLGAIYSF